HSCRGLPLIPIEVEEPEIEHGREKSRVQHDGLLPKPLGFLRASRLRCRLGLVGEFGGRDGKKCGYQQNRHSASRISTVRSASKGPAVWDKPLGQRISTRSTRDAAPSPKWS